MPMGNVKGGTNCQACIDCEQMVSPTDTCFRCYGENKYMAAPHKNDFAINEPLPPKIAPPWCPHRRIVHALMLIRAKEIRSPQEFAKEMWPDSEGWQRYGKVGHGVHKGAGMNLAAGGFLGKLRYQGLIWGGYNQDRVILTDRGRERLSAK